MARPTLERHRKFKQLWTRLPSLGIPREYARHCARAFLEFIWDSANESGDPYFDDEENLEAVAEWAGQPKKLAGLLIDCGFVDEIEGGGIEIHNFWDHCPDYVRKRFRRESERKGKTAPKCRQSRVNTAQWRDETGQVPDNDRTDSSQSPVSDRTKAATGSPPTPTPTPTPTPIRSDLRSLSSEPAVPTPPLQEGDHPENGKKPKKKPKKAPALKDTLADYPRLDNAFPFMLSKLKKIHPHISPPTPDSKGWFEARQTLVQLITCDHIDPEDVGNCLKWLMDSDDMDAEFWREQVHSLKALRHKKAGDPVNKFQKIFSRYLHSKAKFGGQWRKEQEKHSTPLQDFLDRSKEPLLEPLTERT